MGARLLRRWLGQPLLDLEPLERRLAAVQFFHDDAFLRTEATSALSRVADLERILSRIQAQTATPPGVGGAARQLAGRRRSIERLVGRRRM